VNRIISLSDYFFRRSFLGHPIPLIASFKLTYRCNLQCAPCPFHLRKDMDNSHISWDGAINALDKLKSMGCRFVVFEGGEPLLWKESGHDFPELIRYTKKHFLRVAATTNGTLPLDCPTDILWVSVDGLRESHNRLRNGTFDRVWQNLEQSAHPKLLVHLTLNRINWKDLEGLVFRLKTIPSVRGVTLQIFYPYGQGEESLALSQAERRAALEKAVELKKRGIPILNSTACLRAMIENRWTCHDNLLINVDPDGTLTTGCYAKNRGKVRCSDCGFTPVAEASRALDLLPGSVISGWRTFLSL
jgi:Fe-coproporphyrin III synthase